MNQHLCRNESETQELAATLGATCCGGEIFALLGNLGMGKTTFVKGLARGLGSEATVTSPTFNLVHRYHGLKLSLLHYDLYRLKKLQEIEALDLESEMEQGAVLAIEWPQLVEQILPARRTTWVEFAELKDGARSITLRRPTP